MSLLGSEQSGEALGAGLQDSHSGPFLDRKAGERSKLNSRAEKMLETLGKDRAPASCYGGGGSLFTDKSKRLTLKFQTWGRD